MSKLKTITVSAVKDGHHYEYSVRVPISGDKDAEARRRLESWMRARLASK